MYPVFALLTISFFACIVVTLLYWYGSMFFLLSNIHVSPFHVHALYMYLPHSLSVLEHFQLICASLFSEIFQGLDIESEMEKINRPRHQQARKQMGWDSEQEELSSVKPCALFPFTWPLRWPALNVSHLAYHIDVCSRNKKS